MLKNCKSSIAPALSSTSSYPVHYLISDVSTSIGSSALNAYLLFSWRVLGRPNLASNLSIAALLYHFFHRSRAKAPFLEWCVHNRFSGRRPLGLQRGPNLVNTLFLFIVGAGGGLHRALSFPLLNVNFKHDLQYLRSFGTHDRRV